MLVIRTEQMRAFEEDLAQNFRQRLRDHLIEVVPQPANTDLLIESGIPVAQEFGLTSERHIATFLEITGLRFGGALPASGFPIPALSILMAFDPDSETKLRKYAAWALDDPMQRAPSTHG